MGDTTQQIGEFWGSKSTTHRLLESFYGDAVGNHGAFTLLLFNSSNKILQPANLERNPGLGMLRRLFAKVKLALFASRKVECISLNGLVSRKSIGNHGVLQIFPYTTSGNPMYTLKSNICMDGVYVCIHAVLYLNICAYIMYALKNWLCTMKLDGSSPSSLSKWPCMRGLLHFQANLNVILLKFLCVQ